MKLNKAIFSILLSSSLVLGLSSCKKDKDSSGSSLETADVTITVVTDVDADPKTTDDQTPVKDAVIEIVPSVVISEDLLSDVAESDKQTDSDGKFTYKKLLVGSYLLGADDNVVSGAKVVQLFPGENEVTIIVQ